ncbi:MAG: poly-gamma-glutamate synthase PgsB [Verrucomicrobia bacterium]|nr:poly-gamma-glutamate synthase PgsB [Verrucomicrobiota bacterium]
MLALIGGATGLVALHLAVEAAGHARRLRRIPVRIHVNGTRGKTSVTRRLAAALRAAGVRTMGKITGDEPRIILPDGTEEPIVRRGPARIQEQVRFVRQAEARQVQAIVVECMALAPELQRVAEERMMRSTHGIITNVRPDHFEVMGDSLAEVADALAATIPHRGVLVTAERRFFSSLAARAAERGSRIVPVAAGEGAGGSAPEAEHAAIVATVLREMGLSVPGGEPVPAEHQRLWRWGRAEGRALLLDAFSANDPVSTRLLVHGIESHFGLPGPRIALFNHRADRPCRLQSFAADLRAAGGFAAVALIGEQSSLARRQFRGVGGEIWDVARLGATEAALGAISTRVGGGDFTLVGMGNAKGPGLQWARLFAEKGEPCR